MNLIFLVISTIRMTKNTTVGTFWKPLNFGTVGIWINHQANITQVLTYVRVGIIFFARIRTMSSSAITLVLDSVVFHVTTKTMYMYLTSYLASALKHGSCWDCRSGLGPDHDLFFGGRKYKFIDDTHVFQQKYKFKIWRSITTDDSKFHRVIWQLLCIACIILRRQTDNSTVTKGN